MIQLNRKVSFLLITLSKGGFVMRSLVEINPSLVKTIVLHSPENEEGTAFFIYVGEGTDNDVMETICKFSTPFSVFCDNSYANGEFHIYSGGNC